MDTPSYGRTVALTHESLAAMSERQAKQKALKDELDRQMAERRGGQGTGGVDTTGMSKAQKKLLELQELRQQNRMQQQQQHAQPSTSGVYQSQSLPANFAMPPIQGNFQPLLPSVNQPRAGGDVGVGQSGEYGAGGQPAYDSRSLPANYQMMAANQQPFSGSMYAGSANPLPIQQQTQGWVGPPMGMLMSPTHPQQQQQQQYGQHQPPMQAQHPPPSQGGYQQESVYAHIPPAGPQQAPGQGYAAPRQVFSMSDIMGFVNKATDAPPSPTSSNQHHYASRGDAPNGANVVSYNDHEEGMGSGSSSAPVPPKGSGGAKAKPASGMGARGAPAPSANGKRAAATPSVGAQRGLSVPSSPSAGGHPPSSSMGARAPSSSQGKDRHMQNKVDRLQKELEARETQMAKIMEKNKNWEQQAMQLQQQLKDEKKRNRVVVPTRAETAPNATSHPPKKLDPIVRPTNAAPGKNRARPSGAAPAPASSSSSHPLASPNAGGGITSPRSTLVPGSHPKGGLGGFGGGGGAVLLVDREDQRPITAPDVLDPATQLMRSGHLPPLQRPAQSLQATAAGMSRQPLAPMEGHKPAGGGPNKPLPLRQTIAPRQNFASTMVMGRGGASAPFVDDGDAGEEGGGGDGADDGEEPVSYMGDPSAVRVEEDRVINMMGSRAGFAFHSRRGLDDVGVGPRHRGGGPPSHGGLRVPPRGGALQGTAGDGHGDAAELYGEDVDEEGEADGPHSTDGGLPHQHQASFSMDHLQWFVTIRLITAQQGRKLWAMLAGCEADAVPVEHVIPEGYDTDEGEEEAGVDDYGEDAEYEEAEDLEDEGDAVEEEEEEEEQPVHYSAHRAPVPPSSSASQSRHHRRPSLPPTTAATSNHSAAKEVPRRIRGPSMPTSSQASSSRRSSSGRWEGQGDDDGEDGYE